MISSITMKEIMFWNVNLIYAIRNVLFTFDLKKLIVNALRFLTEVVFNILPCTANFTREDRSTILEV